MRCNASLNQSCRAVLGLLRQPGTPIVYDMPIHMPNRNVTHAVSLPHQASFAPVFLTHQDLSLRYLWVGATLGFSYTLDAARLQEALQAVLQSFPVLAGRYSSVYYFPTSAR